MPDLVKGTLGSLELPQVTIGNGVITDVNIADNAAITATKIPALSTVPVQTVVSTSVSGGVFNGGFEQGTGSIAAGSTGYIGSESYGWYKILSTTNTASFDNTVAHSGIQSMKIASTGAGTYWVGCTLFNVGTGAVTDHRYVIPIKAGTSYSLSGFGMFDAGTNIKLRAYSYTGIEIYTYQSNAFADITITTTGSWQPISKTFTAPALSTGIVIFMEFVSSGTGQNAWFDDITLEEVQTSTVAVKEPTYISEVIQGSTSTTSIDQSAIVNTGPTNIGNPDTRMGQGQTFIPTKKNFYGFNFFKMPNIGSPIHDITASVYTTTAGLPTAILASKLITSAVWNAIPDNSWATVTVPCILTPGTTYALTLQDLSGVPDASNLKTIGYGTGSYSGGNKLNYNSTGSVWSADAVNDLMFQTLYAKPTEGTTLTSNGVSTVLRSDGDGILNGAVIDIDNGKYKAVFDTSTEAGGINLASNIFSATAGGVSAATSIINQWGYSSFALRSDNSAGDKYLVMKINTILPVKQLTVGQNCYQSATYLEKVWISPDNVTWTQILTPTNATAAYKWEYTTTSIVNGLSVFFVRFGRTSADASFFNMQGLNIEADLDTSSVVLPRFYPINTTLQRSANWIVPGKVLSYVFRKAKYTNSNGIIMPAWELNDSATGNGNALGVIMCEFDNSGETIPSGRVLSGSTGVLLDTIGLSDGQYVALSSGATSGMLNYQLGGGTTTFINPTKNRFYLSSNGSAIASDRDPSLQAGITYGIRTQGIVENVTTNRKKLRAIQSATFKNTYRITVPVGTTTIRETYGATHLIIGVPSTSSAVTVDLDCSLLSKVKSVTIKDESGAANTNNITISTSGPCKIDGLDTKVINTAYGSYTLYSSGTAWFVR